MLLFGITCIIFLSLISASKHDPLKKVSVLFLPKCYHRQWEHFILRNSANPAASLHPPYPPLPTPPPPHDRALKTECELLIAFNVVNRQVNLFSAYSAGGADCFLCLSCRKGVKEGAFTPRPCFYWSFHHHAQEAQDLTRQDKTGHNLVIWTRKEEEVSGRAKQRVKCRNEFACL